MKKALLFLLCFSFFTPIIKVYANSSRSYIVMDVDSGRILDSKNTNTKLLIASTTKIMTCIVVLENANLNSIITVGEEVTSMYGTNIYIKVGEKLSVKDLLYGLMLRSGNDAAITLAVHTLGEEKFVEKMNETAQRLGMKSTFFENPHGLDDKTKNYSTAYDMALLGKYAFQNQTYREIISTKKYSAKSSAKSYIWYNRMSLLNQYKYCIGGKNGYTPKAGKSLLSYASKNGMTLMIISLNDSDIYSNHKRLYEKNFSIYQNYTIIDKDHFYFKSTFVEENLYLKKSFQYPLLTNEVNDISTLIELHPLNKSGKTGKITIRLRDKKIGELPVFIKKETKKKELSFFQKLKKLFTR